METRVVVLAAGEGTRMKSKTPKVLHELKEKPLISHLLESIKRSGVDECPVVVVGRHAEAIREALGDGYKYVVQEKPLGTGHAVACAEQALAGKSDSVIVLYGDHPYVKPETIQKLAKLYKKSGAPLTMATTTVENFDGENVLFYSFGRIVRDDEGKIASIVEKKDATPDELTIREVNPGYYCFNAEWIWKNLKKVKNENAAGEYYLTELVDIAIGNGERIASVAVEPEETIGVNTPEDLTRVRGIA